MPDLAPQEIRAQRLRAQRLLPRAARDASIEETVRATGGIQAQAAPAMALSLRARIPGLEAGAVRAAIAERRSVVVTWAMRGTLHLLPAEDVGWMVALLGPVFAARDRRRRLELGLTDELCAGSLPAFRAILAGSSPLARGELWERLAAHGVAIERTGQALIHLIQYAALAGVLCPGPQRANGETTYVLLEEWVGPQPALSRDEALARLAELYLAALAPASQRDFAAWSGLAAGDARRGWEAALVAGDYVTAQGGKPGADTLWLPASAAGCASGAGGAGPAVRLLPAWDTYLLGYADRDQVVPPERRGEVYHGGQVVPAVLVDGLAAGVWRYERQGRRLAVQVHLWGAADEATKRGIAAEAEDIGRFMGLKVSLEEV